MYRNNDKRHKLENSRNRVNLKQAKHKEINAQKHLTQTSKNQRQRRNF